MGSLSSNFPHYATHRIIAEVIQTVSNLIAVICANLFQLFAEIGVSIIC
jgi:hypothetical protein